MKHFLTLAMLLTLIAGAYAAPPENPVTIEKKTRTDANIVGHVVCKGEHIPFASVAIVGTTIGTTTDETGHFHIVNVPVGEHTIKVSMVGYRTEERRIVLKSNETTEAKFDLEEDVLNLDEIVISADRNAQKRTEAAVIVNSLSPKLYSTTQSLTFGEGLNFTPGLRMENDCQNCGFSQVRMNGMEGPYSQILINNRPIFSGLAGVYGLELLPSNMIERVEVVRGGGSALYGSNAIAGTINIILKDPINNTYEAGSSYALTGLGVEGSGGAASDYSVNFNASVVSEDHRSGASVYGFTRERQMFDANNDDFSEIAPLNNVTFGGRAFHKFSYRDKLALDFFAIHEERDGGNKQDYPLHERDIAEAVTHDMKVGALTYERFFREYDLLTLYASSQFLDRDSYYGAEQSVQDYGFTQDRSYNVGVQYKALFGEKASLVAGIENTGGFLEDNKLGYPDYENAVISGDSIISIPHTENTTVADQRSITTGIFAQYDIRLGRAKVSAGLRYDNYAVTDFIENDGKTTGNVLSPRLSLMFDASENMQLRASYSQGYRAPQIFDEDLHIETSGSRQVFHEVADDLSQETSHSLMASMDFNKMFGNVYVGFLFEGFYTRLLDAFVNDIGEADEDGVVIYTRENADGGASVQGVNMELKIKPMKNFQLSSGFTVQSSEYEEVQDWGSTRFLRAPNTYGFMTFDWDFYEGLCLSATGNYTGSMDVLYEGLEQKENINANGVVETDDFLDIGAKLSYTIKLNGASLELSTGMKNIFNAYQSDFDSGIDRDPAYIYGPLNPRT